MLSAENSLKFVHDQVQKLAQGGTPQELAIHQALAALAERWSVPGGNEIDQGLIVAERIGQDLAELQRHLADLQSGYMKALFGSDA